MTRNRNARLVFSTGGEVAPSEPESPATPVRAEGIRLRLERRASGRVVTLVTGLPGTPGSVAELAKGLKVACGTGGTLKDGALELQGDHRQKVEAALAARGLRSKRAGG